MDSDSINIEDRVRSLAKEHNMSVSAVLKSLDSSLNHFALYHDRMTGYDRATGIQGDFAVNVISETVDLSQCPDWVKSTVHSDLIFELRSYADGKKIVRMKNDRDLVFYATKFEADES